MSTFSVSQIFQTVLISSFVSAGITYGSLYHMKEIHHTAFADFYHKHKSKKDQQKQ